MPRTSSTVALILARWPEPKADVDAGAVAEINWLIRLVGEVRTAKNELGIPPGTRLNAFVQGASETSIARITSQSAAIGRLARLDSVDAKPAPTGGALADCPMWRWNWRAKSLWS